MSKSTTIALAVFILAFFAVSMAWAHHECGAVRSVVIEYHSEVELCLSPDSTVTIYYDENNKETHRDVVIRAEHDSLTVMAIWGEPTNEDTVLHWDISVTPNPDWELTPAKIDSLIKALNGFWDKPVPED